MRNKSQLYWYSLSFIGSFISLVGLLFIVQMALAHADELENTSFDSGGTLLLGECRLIGWEKILGMGVRKLEGLSAEDRLRDISRAQRGLPTDTNSYSEFDVYSAKQPSDCIARAEKLIGKRICKSNGEECLKVDLIEYYYNTSNPNAKKQHSIIHVEGSLEVQ